MSVSEQEAVREALQAMVAPLHDEMRKVDALIVSTTVQLGELRETKRALTSVLKQLDPGSFTPAKKNGRSVYPRSKTGRTDDVLAFLNDRLDLGDGFNYTWVFEQMKTEGARIGKEAVRTAILELHERGVLRFDRTTSGGGKVYKLVAP